ncbi:MAG: secondary thiamine-phosphate synthase enzyme YjbQ [Candidatus Woesearchaeota archaeon]
MKKLTFTTNKKEQIIDITKEVEEIISHENITEGICVLYCPHTTAGITINESADPDVKSDVLKSFKDIVKELNFDHVEGNSSSHVKTIMTGKSQTLIIDNGKLVLGTWDAIYFCEYDGPRTRNIYVKIIQG